MTAPNVAPKVAPPWSVLTLSSDETHELHPARAAADAERVGMPPPLHAHMVRCPAPGCGRMAPPDMLLDLRPLGAEIRAACGLEGCDFCCDGCRETALRTGALTHEAIAIQHGAPAAARLAARAHDAARIVLWPAAQPTAQKTAQPGGGA